MTENPRKPKILLIDDAEIMRRYLRLALGDDRYEFLEAQRADVALEILRSEPDIALILCDQTMPGGSGLSFLEAKNQRPETARIPVLMVTSMRSKKMIEEGKRLGVMHWLTKPIEKKAVAAFVRQILEVEAEKKEDENRYQQRVD